MAWIPCRSKRAAMIRRAGSAGVVLALCALLLPQAGSAIELEGRISTVNFVSETFPPEQQTEWLMINRLGLVLKDIGTPTLSAHWFGSHRGELAQIGFGKSMPHTYQGYLRYQPVSALSLELGRLWAYGGVGTSLLDGFNLLLRREQLGQLSLFAGTRNFLISTSNEFAAFGKDDFDESGTWGARYSSPELPAHLQFGLSWARSYIHAIEESNLIGVTLGWRPAVGSNIHYEQRYDLGEKFNYFIHLRYRQRLGPGSGSITWNRRARFIPKPGRSYLADYFRGADWYAASFRHPTNELRAHFLYPLGGSGWDINLRLLEIFPEGADRGDGFAFSFSRSIIELGLLIERGFGGDRSDIFGSFRYPIIQSGEGWMNRTWLWATLNQVYYKYGIEELGTEAEMDDKTFASRFGFDFVMFEDLDATTAMEVLSNPRAEYQVRFLFRLGYRFDTNPED